MKRIRKTIVFLTSLVVTIAAPGLIRTRDAAAASRYTTDGSAIARRERGIQIGVGHLLAKNKSAMATVRAAASSWNAQVPGLPITVNPIGVAQPGPGNGRDEIWFAKPGDFFGELKQLELTWIECGETEGSACRITESDTVIATPLDGSLKRAVLNGFSAVHGASGSGSSFNRDETKPADLSPQLGKALQATSSDALTSDDLWVTNRIPSEKGSYRPVRILEAGIADNGGSRFAVARGKAYEAEFLVGNSGSTERTIVTGVYVSTNATITTFDQRLVGSSLSLAPHSFQTIRTSFTLPANLEVGRDYAIGLIIDEEAEVSEPDETNNATFIPIRVN